MPLTPGKSPKVVSANISELASTGKYPPKQAVAIALSNARKPKALTTATGTPITTPKGLAQSQGLQVDKAAVNYTDHSTNPAEICMTCAFFVQPGGCQRVKGLIAGEGWCKLYDPDKADRLANWGRAEQADAASRKEFASDAQRRAFFGNLANDTLSGGSGGSVSPKNNERATRNADALKRLSGKVYGNSDSITAKEGAVASLKQHDNAHEVERYINAVHPDLKTPMSVWNASEFMKGMTAEQAVDASHAGSRSLENDQIKQGQALLESRKKSERDIGQSIIAMSQHRIELQDAEYTARKARLAATGTKERKIYQTPRPLGFFERFGRHLKAGLQVLRGDDGARFMFSITSNSYKDREGEAMTTKALSRYVDSAWKDGSFVAKQPVYFWHEDDLPAIGSVVWADMEGPFLIEVFKEASNAFAKSVWDYVETHPKEFGTSHGFDYPLAALDDQDVYHDIDKFESSVLPHFAAANQYTVSTVIGEKSMSKSSEKDQYLDQKILGRPGAAQQLRRVPKAMHKALTEAGIGHKEKGIADSMRQKLHAHIAKITDDPNLQAALHQTIAAHHAANAGAMGAGEEPDGDEAWGAKETDDDMDEETKEEGEGDEEAEEEEDTEDRRGDEKSQPGYEEPDQAGFPVMTPALVNSAITKQPGSFPPPVTTQQRTGKSRYVTQEEFATGMKEIHDLGEAMRELVGLMDQQRTAPDTHQASSDPMTVINNPDMLKAIKNLNEKPDPFWHQNLG